MEQSIQRFTRTIVAIVLGATLLIPAGQVIAGGGPTGTDNARVFILLDEPFTSAHGTVPPPGWRNYAGSQTTLLGWRFDAPPGLNWRGTMYPPVAMVDNSGPGSSEAILESPRFNAASSHQLILSFEHVFSLIDTGVIGIVEVFDGYAWHRIAAFNSPLNLPRMETFDITSIAGCSPQAAIRFRWISHAPGYWQVDNVIVSKRVLVAAPAPIANASPLNGATAVNPRGSLGWTPGTPCPAGYYLYLGTDNPPTNIFNGTDVGANTSYTPPTRFELNTTYYWRIVSYNLFGQSASSPVMSFTTGSNPGISALPYSQNFDGNTYGWSSENTNGDPYTWELTNTNARSAPTAVLAVPNPNSVVAANDWLFTPPLQLQAGHRYEVEFWARAVGADQYEGLQLCFGTDQLSFAMQNVPIFRNVRMNNTAYEQITATFTAPHAIGTADVVVGWNFISQARTNGLLLDDVTIRDLGAAPVVYESIAATQAGANAVMLSWRVLSQTNNRDFMVEKATAPSLDFVTLPGSLVIGHGTTSAPQDYFWIDNSPGATATYYRLKQTSVNGDVYYSNAVRVDGVTSVRTSGEQPLQFGLSQNYPNPFNPTTSIKFQIPNPNHVTLKVFDVLGREVATLVDGVIEAGEHQVQWNASGFTSGIYFYRLESNGVSATRKLVLMK